mgnify:CR=1 FL=1
MKMNVPNSISFSRLCLIPVLLLLVIFGEFPIAILVLVLIDVLDLSDGFIARKIGQVTLLGKYLDPFADKMLLLLGYVSLAVMGIIPLYLLITCLTRDILLIFGFIRAVPSDDLEGLIKTAMVSGSGSASVGKPLNLIQNLTLLFALFTSCGYFSGVAPFVFSFTAAATVLSVILVAIKSRMPTACS